MKLKKQPWTKRDDLKVIGEPLGEGCFGSVWKALHTLEDRHYAVKQIFVERSLVNFDGNVKKLLNEVKCLSKINCQNVVKYISSWPEGPDSENLHQETHRICDDDDTSTSEGRNFIFIQMELCESTLKDWLKKNPSMESRRCHIPQIIIQLTTALDAVHQRNIIHRDLKPTNIFSKMEEDADGGGLTCIWKLGDFGLATIISTSTAMDISVRGNKLYKSPELEMSKKSDVYSLGIIFLEILNPPEEKLMTQLYDLRENEYSNNYEVIQRLIPSDDYPKEASIIMGMLSPNPDDRLNTSQILKRLKPKASAIGEKSVAILCGVTFLIMSLLLAHLGIRFPIGSKTSQDKPFSFGMSDPASNFVGRKNEMKTLQDTYGSSKSFVTVTGIGGIGKSDLVRKFATEIQKDDFINGVWLNGDSQEGLYRSILAAAEKLGVTMSMKNQPMGSVDILIDIVNLLTERVGADAKSRVLVIIDNVDKAYNEIQTLIKTLDVAKCFLIITSRSAEVLDFVGPIIHVDVLESAEAQLLVSSSIQDPLDVNDIESLCILLHNFPLALQQAVSYIKRQKIVGVKGNSYKIRDYIEDFETRKVKLLDFPLNKFEHKYQLTTLVTWDISLEAIKNDEKAGKLAIDLINIISYLQPNGIRFHFIVDIFDQINKNQKASNIAISSQEHEHHVYKMEDAIELLKVYWFIKCDDLIISIHRIVQEVIRVKLTSSNRDIKVLRELMGAMMTNNNNLDPVDLAHPLCVLRHALQYKDFLNLANSLPGEYLSPLELLEYAKEMMGFTKFTEKQIIANKDYFHNPPKLK